MQHHLPGLAVASLSTSALPPNEILHSAPPSPPMGIGLTLNSS